MFTKKASRFFVLCLCVFLLFSTAAAEEKKPIVTSDVLKIKTMGQIDISPDGKRVVFVVTSMDKNKKEEYRYNSHLWMLDLEKLEPPIQLTFGERGDSSPVWAPDSTRIAFVRTHEGRPQIWILSMQGGEAYRVTSSDFGAYAPQWSPDGKKLLFSATIPDWALDSGPTWPYERPGRAWGDAPNWQKIEHDKIKKAEDKTAVTEETKKTPDEPIKADPDGTMEEIRAWLAKNEGKGDPKVITRTNFQGERELQKGIGFPHLFVCPAEADARASQLTKGMQSFYGADWSPDGQSIVCSSLKYENHPDRTIDGDIWILKADGSEARLLLDWDGHMVNSPIFSPDGKSLLFMVADQNDYVYSLRQLATMDLTTKEPHPLTFAFDRSVSDYYWSADGRFVYFVSPDQGDFPLFRIPAAGGTVQTVVGGDKGVQDLDVSAQRLVYTLTEVKNPLEMYVSDLEGKNPRQITSFNSQWIEDRELVFPEEKWLLRPDGRRIQYWVMPPAKLEPGKTYPLAVEIHGGPSAMWGPGEFSMWHEFQLLAGRGYGVVYCNPRGSGGYGYDFKKANYRDWGIGPGEDILAVCSEAEKLDWVDPDRLVVTGGSYAGYMTAWLVTQDHRFKAAVAQRGVYEISVFFGESNAYRLVPTHYGGYPWEEEVRKYLDANSPLTHVENIQTPLLIIHADRDLRAGVIQSEMLYKSLKILKKPVEYVRYPEEGHELSRSGHPNRRMDRLNRIIEFFDRFVHR
ncbi:MAG: S9 family peptidase, partial [Acidobacteria bacterium]|nr:S9 family peptidase [Acidobacteriota bacterium]